MNKHIGGYKDEHFEKPVLIFSEFGNEESILTRVFLCIKMYSLPRFYYKTIFEGKMIKELIILIYTKSILIK